MDDGKSSNELKTQIIDSAQKVFGKYGLKKTTMDDIAKKVNKAKGALYYYFRSKEEIYEAVLEKEADIFREQIAKAIAGQTLPKGKMRLLEITRIKLFKKLINFNSSFQKEYYENYPFIRKICDKHEEETLQLLISILQDGKDNHELVIEDIEITSLAILKAMKGIELHWASQSNLENTEVMIECLLNALFNGLYKR